VRLDGDVDDACLQVELPHGMPVASAPLPHRRMVQEVRQGKAAVAQEPRARQGHVRPPPEAHLPLREPERPSVAGQAVELDQGRLHLRVAAHA